MIGKLPIAVLVTVGLIAMPFAAQAKKYRHLRHNISTMQPGTYGGLGTSATPSTTYGTSGTAIGTVTAPSVGSYNWPSVGVTNAVPTWSNTNPQVHR